MAYLLDTNVFLQAKNLHYGYDFCPGFWDWPKTENVKGNVFSIEKVKDELVDDDASLWADAQTIHSFSSRMPRSPPRSRR
jgi:hypothetical protein